MSATFEGLTWDHPRGYNALAAAAAQDGNLRLHWARQPLEGFESASIAALARDYDLLVLDHPHLGDALESGCLQSLDSLFPGEVLDTWRTQSIGQCFESYCFGGHLWALPLDAATQVAVTRRDRLNDSPPSDWRQVPRFARHNSTVLSLAGPHAFLTLCSLTHAFGCRMGDHQETLFTGGDPTSAWDLLAQLYGLRTPGWDTSNPIALLHGMSTTDGPAYCPLVYGYVTYAGPDRPGEVLHFLDAPAGPRGQIGSVLGGTGIALTQRCEPTPALLDHLCALLSPTLQADFIPHHDGQPSTRSAWMDRNLDQQFNGFYSGTRRTLESAFVRPRYPGYTRFQLQASESVRTMLAGKTGACSALGRLQDLHAASIRSFMGDDHRPIPL